MEPPLKRPRLSIFANMGPDPELDEARHSNDMVLKSRFEAIFEKYAHDFTDIGDVVDLNTGQIEQDNGHLRGIEDEKDTGQSRSRSLKPAKDKPANGQSLLRAMTVATDRNDSYFDDDNADDVIHSIEVIAENAAVSDEEEEEDAQQADESEDDLMDPVPHPSIKEERNDYSSGPDSLFEVVDPDRDQVNGDCRFSSPDSLMQGITPPSAAQQNSTYEVDEYRPLDDDDTEEDVANEFDEKVIYAKFGKTMGKEVLQLLEKRDKAELHIDPAWRIPVKAQPRPTSSAGSYDTVSEESLDEPPKKKIALQNNSSPNKGMSIWIEGTRRNGSRFGARAKAIQSLREESEDPLQEGFHSDSESDEEIELERCNKVAKRGVCPYCQEQYVDRVGVMQHMNREAKFIQRGAVRGEHDPEHIMSLIEYIHKKAREKSSGTSKGPRLVMCDYKTLVELHEGAGMTFQEIIDSETLRTLKNSPELLLYLYCKWRDVDDINGMDGQPSREWSKTENNIIKSLRKTPTTSMDLFKKKLSRRTPVEIGNKLADMWLTELHSGKLPEEEEDESELEIRAQPKSNKRKREAPTAGFDGSFDHDESTSSLEDVSAQSFDMTFAAATGMTPIPDQIPGLPPMPQSVVRNARRIEPYAWEGDDELTGQPPTVATDGEEDLYVPNIWE